MRVANCHQCRKPTDANLCHDCTQIIAGELTALVELRADGPGELLAELDLVLARLVRIEGRPGEVAPLPIGWAAVQAAVTLQSTLVAWIRSAAAAKGYRVAIRPNLPQMARWLARHADWLRQCPDARQAYDELLYAVDVIRRAVDRPPQLWFAGQCDQCGHDLYGLADDEGRPLEGEITCPQCTAVYRSLDRREYLLAHVRDEHATAAIISRALTTWGERAVTPAMIRKYAHRGHLQRRGYNRKGSPLYRLGDVEQCVAEAETRRPDHGSCATA